jgi:tetratricopeptide (TPR) repeat protein
MQLLDRPPAKPTVTDLVAIPSGQNQKTYTRLKTSLRLNLRRQIFLAVCDDLELRTQLMAQLQTELNSPKLVTLTLNLSDPNPMAQIVQWMAQNPAPDYRMGQSLGFQVLGIEQLTRQPAVIQKRFLSYLQAIEYYMPMLECAMVLWLPRPWLRMVRQSAPTFWNWHTALFEFEGDPTPLRLSPRQRLAQGAGDSLELWASSPIADSQTAAIASTTHLPLPIKGFVDDRKPIDVDLDGDADPAVDAPMHRSDLATSANHQTTLWDILTDDLERLRQDSPTPSATAIPATLTPSAHRLPRAAAIAPVPTPAIALSPDSPTTAPLSPAASLQAPPLPPPSPLTYLVLTAIAENPTAQQHQQALQTLQQVQQLEQQQAPKKAIAAAYYSLGRLYREQIEQGDSTEQTLTISIEAHEQALQWLEEESPLRCDALNDLGNLYWMQSRCAIEPDVQLSSLERAIQAYQQALTKLELQANGQTFAMIQNNLGSAYGDLAQYEHPAEHLQKSVEAYEIALRYRTAEEDPARYAATQNNLGTACWNLAQHEKPVVHLSQAIAAYREALRYYTADRESMSYAMIQNNLGTAYWNLAQHVKPTTAPGSDGHAASADSLLRLAIAAYQNALEFRTAETMPNGYAATQNNLGTAHWNLANQASTTKQGRVEHLHHAIAAYEAAIGTVESLSAATGKLPSLTFDVSATRNNLGLAYYQLATDAHANLAAPKRQKSLETALAQHLEALQTWQPLSELHQVTLEYVIQTVRAFYAHCGIQGQNFALSRIPAQLLPEIMQKI